MVAWTVVYYNNRCDLVFDNATISSCFLARRLDGPVDGDSAWVFVHGRRDRPLGRTVVLPWHSPVLGRAISHAPVPGLTPEWDCLSHERRAALPGPQCNHTAGSRSAGRDAPLFSNSG